VLSALVVCVEGIVVGSCPPGYNCYGKSAAFIKAVEATCVHQNQFGECNQWTPAKLALICDPDATCLITGSRLDVGSNVSIVLENAILANNDYKKAAGALMIVSGEVLGTNISYINGSTLDFGVPGGAVYVMPLGRFSCVDCLFQACHSRFEGAVANDHGFLNLTRPVFKDNTVIDTGLPGSQSNASVGSGCYCELCKYGQGKPDATCPKNFTAASQACIGCECKQFGPGSVREYGVCGERFNCTYCDSEATLLQILDKR
jgi:hypothetical protein